jgi:breast carcinoma-amplified sequence 3
VALGSRWMAYAEKKVLPSKRSSGGCDCGGVQSYTATVLNAAKSLGKGLRELGEHVAAGLTGHPNSYVPGTSPNSCSPGTTGGVDTGIGGIITVLDVKYPIRDISPTTGTPISTNGNEAIIAHFIAHTDPIVALSFDFSGMLLLTADKRGHNFHVFRIHPHPSGAALAAVHHLYVLHRGDTTAKVQDIAFSMDSRWVAVSTMRGTTHVFPVTSYGGPAGVRTHATPHVVNRLSRFHRSAGLSVESGRSSSPVSFSGGSDHYSSTSSIAQSSVAYTNPRQPPFPHPTVILPLAQIRQPTSLANTGAGSGGPNSGQASHKMTHTRQRHSSTSDDASANPLRVAACFAKDRSWLLDPPGLIRDTPAHRMQRRPVDSLFIMAGHGALIQYDLDPRHSSSKITKIKKKMRIATT